MAVRGNLGMRRYVETNGVETRLRGIAGQHRRPDAGNARCSGAGAVPRLRVYFVGRQADLRPSTKARCTEQNKQTSARSNVSCDDLPLFTSRGNRGRAR